MAKGLLDIACHELAARQVGRPVHDLIGGAVIDRIPLCGLLPLLDPETTALYAKGYQDGGYRSLRIKLGTSPHVDRDVIAAVREGCGDDLRLRVDYNQAYDVPTAVRALSLIEPYGIDAAEQPLPVGDLLGMVELQRRTPIPVFLHEGFFSLPDAVALIDAGGMGVMGINAERPGGITGALRAIDYAAARGLGTILHNQPLGIGTAVQAHIVAARYDRLGHHPESAGDVMFDHHLTTSRYPIEGGELVLPGGPGWGITVDRDALAPPFPGPPSSTPLSPTLFRRGRLFTPTPAPAGHDSLAVIDGRIAAIGTEDHCRAALPTDALEVDLAGRSLVPGFIDAHVHPMVMSVFELHLGFERARSVTDVLDAVADAARSGTGTDAGPDGAPIMGFQLDDALLAERRLPTAAELDAAAAGRPVVIVRRDGHHAVASTAAITASGLDDPANVVDGGYVERGSDGRPTGLVGENSVAALLALMPEITMDTLEAGRARWTERLLRQGVTAISAICQTSAEGPSGPAGEMEAVGWSDLAQRVPFDVQTILIAADLGVVDDYRAIPSLHDPASGRRIDAVKLFLDGTLGGASACMHSPFADRSHTSGMRTLGDDDAYARMEAAHLAGLQVCVHAIGDKANLDAALLFERLLTEHPGPHRHRVEHASVLDEGTIDLFAQHQITCVVQPINLHSEVHWLADRLGPERLQRTYPYRSMLDAGVPVAGSSDAPIEDTSVLDAMDASVHRGGLADQEAITAVEALAMYTSGGSAARSTEDLLGKLAPGLRADLAVLDGDVANTRPADLSVAATYIGGVAHLATN